VKYILMCLLFANLYANEFALLQKKEIIKLPSQFTSVNVDVIPILQYPDKPSITHYVYTGPTAKKLYNSLEEIEVTPSYARINNKNKRSALLKTVVSLNDFYCLKVSPSQHVCRIHRDIPVQTLSLLWRNIKIQAITLPQDNVSALLSLPGEEKVFERFIIHLHSTSISSLLSDSTRDISFKNIDSTNNLYTINLNPELAKSLYIGMPVKETVSSLRVAGAVLKRKTLNKTTCIRSNQFSTDNLGRSHEIKISYKCEIIGTSIKNYL